MDSTGGAILVGWDSSSGQSSMRKETEERSEMEWMRSEKPLYAEERREIQRQRRLSLQMFVKALLPGMQYRCHKFSMQNLIMLRLNSEMERQVEEHMFLSFPPDRRHKLIRQYYLMKYEKGQRKAWVNEDKKLLARKKEKQKALIAMKEKSARRAKAKAKAKATAKAAAIKISAALKLAKAKYTKKNQKRQHEEAGRPLESVTKDGKAGKAVEDMNAEGSDSVIQKEAENEMMEISPEMLRYADKDYLAKEIQRALLDIEEKLVKKKNKKTYEDVLLLLLKGMCNRLDQGDYDENDKIDRGKSAIETCLDTNEDRGKSAIETCLDTNEDRGKSAIETCLDTNEDRGKSAIETCLDTNEDRGKSAIETCLDTNEGTDTTMVEPDNESAADPSATNSSNHWDTLLLLLLLLKGLSNQLDKGSYDENNEIDRGKSAEHMPTDWKNPSDRGEASVMVGSSKSVMDQEVISQEIKDSVTAAEAVKEVEENFVLVRMDSSGTIREDLRCSGMREGACEDSGKRSEMQRGEGACEPTGPLEFMGNYYSPEYQEQLMEHHQAPVTEAWGPEEPGTEMDEVGRSKLAIEEHLPMVGFEFKSETETEAGKAEEAVVDLNSEGLIREEDENELGKRLEKIGIRPEMQLCAEEDYFPKGVQRALLDIQEKFAKKKILQQLVKDLSDKFDISMSTSAIEDHTPMVESEKLLHEPADPSATSSLTRLGIQDDHGDHERGESSATPLVPRKTADEEMASEAKHFDRYRRDWEGFWGPACGSFDHMTVLSSMQFTYYTPGRLEPNIVASTPVTLQIFSIKLAQVVGDLRWPLSVYGVVAVRDVVDHNRNFLFSCDRDGSQELTQNDPFLRLIGPSRAVVFTDEVNIEIELKVKGATEYQDKALITEGCVYDGAFGDGVSTVCFKNCLCTIDLCVQTVRSTIQATILGVQIAIGEPFPFKYGARVTCSPVPGEWDYTDNRRTHLTYPASGEIVMVDSKDGAMLKGSDGYLHLPRNVISVESEGRLDVYIQSYSKSGAISAKERVSFLPKFSKISRKTCCVGGVMMAVTVAWSLVTRDKYDLMVLGSMV